MKFFARKDPLICEGETFIIEFSSNARFLEPCAEKNGAYGIIPVVQADIIGFQRKELGIWIGAKSPNCTYRVSTIEGCVQRKSSTWKIEGEASSRRLRLFASTDDYKREAPMSQNKIAHAKVQRI